MSESADERVSASVTGSSYSSAAAAERSVECDAEPALPHADVVAHENVETKSSYREILRSSTLIGGSTLVGVVIGIVRTKTMAVLLGPEGFGLMGIFTSIADLARTVAEMGINSSGVRQIAEAVGSGDDERIARTVVVLRRVAIALGLIGASLLIAFARPISSFTFGTPVQAGAIALLSIAVLLRLVADGQQALLQGLRRIGDIVRTTTAGALLGTLLAILIVYALGRDGVVPAIVAGAAASLVVSWWTVRRVPLPSGLPTLTTAQVRLEVSSLLRLGLAFMASGFLTMGAAYAVRMVLVRHDGLDAAGLYQAAWTIGGLYVGFVLQAMGADFYPRLVGVSDDDTACCRLVNEQAQVSLLLAGCGVIATISFAPLIVALLYSGDFAAASDTLRWITLGMAMRVITWPVGYILVAKGKQALFIATDLTWAIVNVGLTWLAVGMFGLIGAGIAFFGSYLVHLLVVYPIARQLAGFRWSTINLRTGALFISITALVFCGFHGLKPVAAMMLGGVATIVTGIYTFHTLRKLAMPERVPSGLFRLLQSGKARSGPKI